MLLLQAFDRINVNLNSLHDSRKLANDTKMARIAADVVSQQATVAVHPLGF